MSLVWSLVSFSGGGSSAAGEGFSVGIFLALLVYGFLVLSLPSFCLNLVKSILANPDTALFSTGTGTGETVLLPLTASSATAADPTPSSTLAAQPPRSGTRRSLVEILCVKKKSLRFSFMLLASAALGFLQFGFWTNLHLFVPAVLALIIFAEKLTNVKKRKTKGDDDSRRGGASAAYSWLPVINIGSSGTGSSGTRLFAKRL